ncbi:MULTISPECIES: DUF92 domain-containing protein [Chitinophaga]|uniref:DUF92 domain-containing protein n=1 Tax=Chitinophaga TaxID=79328 RepID=UPI001B3B2BCF|nr:MULTISPECIES: DUF92 domain-containing protein [Chitinophaga]
MMQLTSLTELAIAAIIIIIVAFLCVKKGKLTGPAAVTAAILGMCVALGIGYGGLLLLGAFFITGVAATGHKKGLKTVPGEQHAEKRTAGQVFANGGVAGISALLALSYPDHERLFILMAAGSLAAATADTVSSELGTVYGRNFRNILTFKKEAKGLDGVISLEGTLLGAAGALLLAVLYWFFFGGYRRALLVLIGGILGNVVDSLLGATLERKQVIGNDTVNFLNTLSGGLIAVALYLLS